MSRIKQKDRSLAEQVYLMKIRHPLFATNFSSHSSIKIAGVLQPTSRSNNYHFVLIYNLKEDPKIKIVSPTLQKNSKGDNIPHLYAGENLCLYRPKYCEFSRTDFLGDTIIPWTSLWLYYYELWHLTDEWRGGGEHPITQK
jgi:hypothetical protein